MRLVAAACFAAYCVLASAQADPRRVAVAVGYATIAIPIPQGYSVVPQQQAELLQIATMLTPERNRLLAVIVPSADLRAFGTGTPPNFDSYILIQVSRKLEGRTLSAEEFAQVRQRIRAQQNDLVQISEQRFPQIVSRLQKENLLAPGALDIAVGDAVQLGIIGESPSMITFSALSRVRIAQAGTSSSDQTMVSVACNVVPKGQLLFLFAYAKLRTAADLDRTQKRSLAWCEELLEINR